METNNELSESMSNTTLFRSYYRGLGLRVWGVVLLVKQVKSLVKGAFI